MRLIGLMHKKEDTALFIGIRLLFMALSCRVDWDSYPGITVAFKLFNYQIGMNMLKDER